MVLTDIVYHSTNELKREEFLKNCDEKTVMKHYTKRLKSHIHQSIVVVTVQTHLKREVFFAAFREKPEYNDENPIA